jgi:hypothetical protein
MAYFNARTTKLYLCELFLVIPFFVCQETSEKDPMEWLILLGSVSNKRHISIWDASWLAAFALLAPASYHQAAGVAKANDQTGLASCTLPPWACQEMALGV